MEEQDSEHEGPAAAEAIDSSRLAPRCADPDEHDKGNGHDDARMVLASMLSTPRTAIFPEIATRPAKNTDSAAYTSPVTLAVFGRSTSPAPFPS